MGSSGHQQLCPVLQQSSGNKAGLDMSMKKAINTVIWTKLQEQEELEE